MKAEDTADTAPAAVAETTPAPTIPSFARHLKETRVVDGEKAVLQCELAFSDESVQFAWLKDNEPLKPSEDFKVRTGEL